MPSSATTWQQELASLDPDQLRAKYQGCLSRDQQSLREFQRSDSAHARVLNDIDQCNAALDGVTLSMVKAATKGGDLAKDDRVTDAESRLEALESEFKINFGNLIRYRRANDRSRDSLRSIARSTKRTAHLINVETQETGDVVSELGRRGITIPTTGASSSRG